MRKKKARARGDMDDNFDGDDEDDDSFGDSKDITREYGII